MSDTPIGRAFDFPSNPQVGDTVSLPDGTTFEWNGTTWSRVETGGGGGGVVRYVHTEAPASTDWTITHNMNTRYMHVQVVDDAGNTVIPDVVFTNANRLDLVFANPVQGTAILRR